MTLDLSLMRVVLRWNNGNIVTTLQGEPLHVPIATFLTNVLKRLSNDLAGVKGALPPRTFWQRLRNSGPQELLLDRDVQAIVEKALTDELEVLKAQTQSGALQ
jgi:hypothetical protein